MIVKQSATQKYSAMFFNNRLDFQECLKDKLSKISITTGLLLKSICPLLDQS